MIYPLIGKRQLDTLRDYIGHLDFEQEKQRMGRPDFDVLESERPLLKTYKQLLIFRFTQNEQDRQSKNPQSYTPARGASPAGWSYRMCLSTLLSEGKETTQAMLNSYYAEDAKVLKKPTNQYTIGDWVQALPFILDRSGVKPLD